MIIIQTLKLKKVSSMRIEMFIAPKLDILSEFIKN
jgi:hypothetical protein